MNKIQSNTPKNGTQPGLRQSLLRLFWSFIMIYGIGMISIFILRIYPGERSDAIGFINSFLHLILLPVLIFVPLCFVGRRWRELLLLSPIFAMFLFTYGQLFLPQSAPIIPPKSETLRVLNHNVLGIRLDYQETVTLILELDADIVALQEVNPILEAQILASLTSEYPHMAIHTHPGTGGQAVLSRYPIKQDAYWIYQSAGLGNQRVTLATDTGDFVLYNVHPTHPGLSPDGFSTAYRDRETRAILQRAAQETLPVLLMGDFNMTELSEMYQEVTADYQDAWYAAGWGMGWTFSHKPETLPPFLRLDYLFYDRHFSIESAEVMPNSAGSDHKPLLVTLHRLP